MLESVARFNVKEDIEGAPVGTPTAQANTTFEGSTLSAVADKAVVNAGASNDNP